MASAPARCAVPGWHEKCFWGRGILVIAGNCIERLSMIMLSQLARFAVTDSSSQRARLADLQVDVGAGDYPPVIGLLIQGGITQQDLVPWEAVKRIDWNAREFQVTDLRSAKETNQDWLDSAVLARRDLLDALLLDLQDRYAFRANDLELAEQNGQLVVRAADVSPQAVLRRVSHGVLGRGNSRGLRDWRWIEFLRGDPRAALAGRDYHRRIARLPPGQIANLMDYLPYLHAAEMLTLLPDPLAADTLESMSPERQLQVFEELDDDQSNRLLALMAPDDAAVLVSELNPPRAQQYLEHLPEPQRGRLLELLQYPRNTAGGIMTNDVVSAPANLTVREARVLLREQLKAPDLVYYIYVVADDASHQLQGVVTLRALLVADDGERLADIMDPYLVTIAALTPADAAASQVIESNLFALPVVGSQGQLLGAITVDVAVAQLAPESWRSQAPRVFS
ncbi:MAG: magnesium transporter MgtE N-terminal domain-containing protein [Thermomicrobiales bacterium]